MTPQEAMALKINMMRLRAILRPDPTQRFQAVSLQDLDARVKLMESTPWEPDLVAELSEKRYRKGYRDGFIAAVEAYRRMLWQDDETHGTHDNPGWERRASIYLRLSDYWNRPLGVWEHADCSQRTHFGVNEQPFEQGGDLPPTMEGK